MASLIPRSARAAHAVSRQLRNAQRSYRTSAPALVAHNFAMPALSPTMTEGNIASWKVKEGDEFSAGDVLLEVETDKANMDVEAQDDGVVAKIMTEGGAKGVKVGTRIAVLADPGDDIKTLEIPAEESKPAQQEEKKSEESKPKESPKEESKPSSESESKPPGKGQKQTYPLYPSVAVLLHQHHIEAEDVPATGPNGRLLKGDVLAYLNEIPSNAAADVAKAVNKLSHLDLSNIKAAAPKQAPKKDVAPAKEEKEAEKLVSIAVPVSLASVLEVQKRMQDTLGISLPLNVFVARAIALANEDLPLPRGTAPSADELFNAVVGLDKLIPARTTKAGKFAPRIVGMPDPSVAAVTPVRKARKSDLFDELVGGSKKVSRASAIPVVSEENIFSLDAVEGKEKERAKVFLERVKTTLEVDPGRLVL